MWRCAPFVTVGGVVMLWGFYRELEELRADGLPDADFGFLENVPVGDAYYLYDFLHGCCDQFAAAVSDYFGYEIEYVVGNDDNLIHAYCVQELPSGETAYIDARGITTDAELFFDEFADFCSLSDGVLYDLNGECQVYRHKDSREMYSDDTRELNQDKELYQFLKENSSYYDVKVFEREYVQVGNVNRLIIDAASKCEAVNNNVENMSFVKDREDKL